MRNESQHCEEAQRGRSLERDDRKRRARTAPYTWPHQRSSGIVWEGWTAVRAKNGNPSTRPLMMMARNARWVHSAH